MKTIFKNTFKVIILFSFILFASCETEQFTQNAERNSKISKKYIKLEDLQKHTNAFNKLNEIKEKTEKTQIAKKNNTGRLLYDSNYDFYIDTDNILYTEFYNYKSYTFAIYKDLISANPKVENLVLSSENQNNFKEYIAKYNLSSTEKEIIGNGGVIPNIKDKTEITTITGETIVDSGVTNKFIYIDNDGNCWAPDHIYIDDTTGELMVTLIHVLCPTGLAEPGGNDSGSSGTNAGPGNPWYGTSGHDTSANNTPNSTPGTNSGNIPGNNGNNNGTTGNSDDELPPTHQPIGVITSPVIMTHDNEIEMHQLSFINGLSTQQQQWLESHSEQKDQILNFLDQHNYSLNNTQFVTQMINLCITNNSTFTFDSTLNSNNSITIDNFQDLQNLINVADLNTVSYSSTPGQNQNQIVSSASINVSSFYKLKIDVKQNLGQNYSIAEVSSNFVGVTFGHNWNQTSYTVNIVGNIATVDLYGIRSLSLFVNGIGTIYEQSKHYKIKIDTTTGHIFATYMF